MVRTVVELKAVSFRVSLQPPVDTGGCVEKRSVEQQASYGCVWEAEVEDFPTHPPYTAAHAGYRTHSPTHHFSVAPAGTGSRRLG